MANSAYAEMIKRGEKVIEYLADAKAYLDSAERWGNKVGELQSVSSFLNILNGTMNDTKYKMAQADLNNAIDELEKFNLQVIAFLGPLGAVKQLQNFKLPEEIHSEKFWSTSITEEQYKEYMDQINKVCSEVSAVVDYLKKAK